MVEKLNSVTFIGIEAIGISIEVLVSNGLPSFKIVGLPDKAVAESKERVRGALIAMGLAFPAKKITVNLAPADIPKEGSHFDLAIALCLMQALGAIDNDLLTDYIVMGELSLDANINSCSGVLPAAIYANSVGKGLICPYDNGLEASYSGLENIVCCKTMFELLSHFVDGKQLELPKTPTKINSQSQDPLEVDFKSIRGQYSAKRALEIAAAGNHNLLMVGPPGSGKSLLARNYISLLPELTAKEAIELAVIRSISKNFGANFTLVRPFRDPHHTASIVSITGGGTKALPGEVSLAHGGVLFLDELPEFSQKALETLRQPLENGEVVISRANHHISYPANFQLIAAMNPCRCGNYGNPVLECPKAPNCAINYQEKLSGPLMDRIDLHVYVEEVQASSLLDYDSSLDFETEKVKKRIVKAREIQAKRFEGVNELRKQKLNQRSKNDYTNFEIYTNSQASADMIESLFVLSPEVRNHLITAANKIGITARGIHRVIKLAQTIADLDEASTITNEAISEALSYRQHTISNLR